MQRLRNTLGSLFTIFAHPHQCRPVPGPKESKKNKPSGLKLPSGAMKRLKSGSLSLNPSLTPLMQ